LCLKMAEINEIDHRLQSNLTPHTWWYAAQKKYRS
jgi:hypothetical protein